MANLYKEAIIYLAIFLFALMFFDLVTSDFSTVTGYTVVPFSIQPVDMEATQDKEYKIYAKNETMTLSSIRVSGEVIGTGYAKVYIENEEGERYLIYSNEDISPNLITGLTHKEGRSKDKSGGSPGKSEGAPGIQKKEDSGDEGSGDEGGETPPDEGDDVTGEDGGEPSDETPGEDELEEKVEELEDDIKELQKEVSKKGFDITPEEIKKAGITSDEGLLWKLEKVVEDIEISLSVDDESKKRLALERAKERILEAKITNPPSYDFIVEEVESEETSEEDIVESEQTNTEIVKEFSGCIETCVLPPEFSDSSYNIIIDVDPGTEVKIDEIIYGKF